MASACLSVLFKDISDLCSDFAKEVNEIINIILVDLDEEMMFMSGDSHIINYFSNNDNDSESTISEEDEEQGEEQVEEQGEEQGELQDESHDELKDESHDESHEEQTLDEILDEAEKLLDNSFDEFDVISVIE